MIEQLFITKKYGNYAVTFLLLGLAQIVEYALRKTNQKIDIQLVDEGTRYRIQLKKAVNLEAIAKLNYTNPFPPVKGQKTDISKIPPETEIFNTVEASEKRKLYKDYVFQQRGKPQSSEDAPQPPHPSTQNGVILTSMRHDRNHNELWQLGWQIKDHYGALLVSLFQAFSEETNSRNTETNRCQELFTQATNCKLPELASAVKIYLPTSVQGVNRVKADTNKVDSQKSDWLSLWLIAGGLFSFGISERIKIADRVFDWRVVVLEPQDIQLSKYRELLDQLRKFNPPSGAHGVARFDAELVLRFCQELLNHHASQADAELDEFDIWEPVNHFVKSFLGTHFGSKGQVYGVKEVFSLGLPGWISPENSQELADYQSVVQEHLSVISTLSAEEGQSELLTAYRDFITGTSLRQFFPFQISYADYVVKRLADPKSRPLRLFSVTGLNTMTKKDSDFIKITQDPSFLRIAKAINQATVYAGKVQTKQGIKELEWQRTYGLAQRLSSQSGSKNDFLKEIADFLAKYEAENLRLSEQLLKEGKPLKRVWTTKEDLDRLVELVTENDTVLVANLLIAYGYARWNKPKDNDLEIDQEPDINDSEDTAILGESSDE